MKKIIVINSLLVAFSLVLSACTAAAAPTQDPNQLAAQVAALVDSQVATKVAQALAAIPTQQPAQPINTPILPTIGPIPTLAPVNVPTLSLPGVATSIPCNPPPNALNENYPDGTSLVVNTSFSKTWTIQNAGTCTWNSNYKIKFVSGDQMSGVASQSFGAVVPPGGSLKIILPLKTTSSVGTSTGYWGLYDDKDVYFGRVWVTINRTAFVPTVNNFRVTSVTTTVDNAAPGACPHLFTFTAQITAIGAGTITYQWDRSDPSIPTQKTLTFSAAGTQTVTETWNLTSAYSGWMQVNIISPNNQTFGHVPFSCS